MTRDRRKAEALFGTSLEVAEGDPTEPASLDAALQGCQGVHISLTPEIEPKAAETVTKLAAHHHLEQIGYISGSTVFEQNRWFSMIDQKFRAEEALHRSGVACSVFCPTWVMDGLPRFVVGGRAAVMGRQPFPYHWVAGEDLARMVSTAFGLPEAADNRFFIHGPQGIRLPDALRRYCAVFHPEIDQVSSMPFWLVRLMAALTRSSELRFAGEMMAYFEKIGELGDPSEANALLGAPATTLDQWLATEKARQQYR